MTKPLRAALEIIIPLLPPFQKILEIGSRYTQGGKDLADLRGLFSKTNKYIGLDLFPGKGVDITADAEKIPYGNRQFDLVLCLETLEHAKNPWQIAKEIQRIVSQEGIVIISTPFNHPLHLHPSDYYRFTPFGLQELFSFTKDNITFSISPPYQNEVKIHPQTVVLIGFMKKQNNVKTKIKKALIDLKNEISVHKPYRHRMRDLFRYFLRGLNEIKFKQEINFFK